MASRGCFFEGETMRLAIRNEGYEKKAKRCMNCGNEIDPDAAGLYATRFCSQQCRDEYVNVEK